MGRDDVWDEVGVRLKDSSTCEGILSLTAHRMSCGTTSEA